MIDLGIIRIFPQHYHTRTNLLVFVCGCQMVTYSDRTHRLNLLPECGFRHDYDDALRTFDPCAPNHWPFQMVD